MKTYCKYEFLNISTQHSFLFNNSVYSPFLKIKFNQFLKFTDFLSTYLVFFQEILCDSPGSTSEEFVHISTVSHCLVSLRIIHYCTSFHLVCQIIITNCGQLVYFFTYTQELRKSLYLQFTQETLITSLGVFITKIFLKCENLFKKSNAYIQQFQHFIFREYKQTIQESIKVIFIAYHFINLISIFFKE